MWDFRCSIAFSSKQSSHHRIAFPWLGGAFGTRSITQVWTEGHICPATPSYVLAHISQREMHRNRVFRSLPGAAARGSSQTQSLQTAHCTLSADLPGACACGWAGAASGLGQTTQDEGLETFPQSLAIRDLAKPCLIIKINK